LCDILLGGAGTVIHGLALQLLVHPQGTTLLITKAWASWFHLALSDPVCQCPI